ncbi:hypothetical protein DL768_010313 [Monosporascus sp. mg162]|nr:hypothetical protein DL768_010313 [Monosporascus sp. mg162]
MFQFCRRQSPPVGSFRSPKTTNTVELDHWGEDQLWSDLALFGPTLREKFDSKPSVPVGDDEKRPSPRPADVCSSRCGFGFAPLDMYAIWAFTDALEGEMTPVRGAPDEINPDPAAVKDLPFKVAIAAAWAFHAGRVLYGRDEEIHGTLGWPLWMLK